MKNIINTLNHHNYLFKSNMHCLTKYIKNIDVNYTPYLKYNSKNYDKNSIYKNNLFEIIIINWMPGQFSNLHSHPENGCIMKILDGYLHEKRYIDNKVIEYNHNKNDMTFIHNNHGTHIVGNNSDKHAISVHIYSPPNFYN